MRFGVISTHLIQYFSGLYRHLNGRFTDFEVAYLAAVPESDQPAKFDPGFQQSVAWDIDLKSGYPWISFDLENVAPPLALASVVQTVKATRRWVRSFRPDVVLIPGWTGLYPVIATTLRAHGVRLILRPEGRVPSTKPLAFETVRSAALRGLMRLFDAAAYTSSSSRDELVRLGMGSDSLVFSPYVIDTDAWAPLMAEGLEHREETRASLGVGPADVLYLFVGKFAAYKRVTELVEIFAKVVKLAPCAKLVLVGDGPDRGEVEKLRDASGLGTHIKMVGFVNQSQLPRLHAAADAFVLLSRETWGLVANEAMLAHLPLVVSVDAGCSRDLVVDGVTGFRVAVSEPDSCVRRLVEIADPSVRARMMPAVELLSREYTLERAAEGIAEAAEIAWKHSIGFQTTGR